MLLVERFPFEPKCLICGSLKERKDHLSLILNSPDRVLLHIDLSVCCSLRLQCLSLSFCLENPSSFMTRINRHLLSEVFPTSWSTESIPTTVFPWCFVSWLQYLLHFIIIHLYNCVLHMVKFLYFTLSLKRETLPFSINILINSLVLQRWLKPLTA